jgi:hypothetical protein
MEGLFRRLSDYAVHLDDLWMILATLGPVTLGKQCHHDCKSRGCGFVRIFLGQHAHVSVPLLLSTGHGDKGLDLTSEGVLQGRNSG